MSYDYSENILVQESAGHLLQNELGWDVAFAYNTEVLGSHICKKLLQMKKQEWETYRSQVTNWELEEYLYKF